MTPEQFTRDDELDRLADVLAAIARVYEGDVPLPDRVEIVRDLAGDGISWPVRVVYDRPSVADLDELVARHGHPHVHAVPGQPGMQTWTWWVDVVEIRATVIHNEVAS